MKAMVIDEFGGPEKLRMAEVPTPRPAADEVLVKLACTGVNPVDWKIREGRLQGRFPHAFPLVLGWDAAGTVAELGSAASGFAPGERVFAYCRKPQVQWGTYAEYVAMTASAVARMPDNISFAQAAAIPLTGLTAWQALFDAAQLRAGQTVLVHAGAGGVGSLAMQFARDTGARVLTTASGPNHNYVMSLGAELAIDYHQEDFVAAARRAVPEGLDVVLDTVGGFAQKDSFRALRPGGILVSIIGTPDAQEAQRLGVRSAYLFVSPDGAQLREIALLIQEGRVRPPEVHELELKDAAAAQVRSQGGHVRGKLVLRIA